MKKPVYLLAGGRPKHSGNQDPFTQAVFRESGKKSPTIAYSGTANGDDARFFRRMADEFLKAGSGPITHAVIDAKNADLGKAKKILESADIVFINGGDVEAGMQVLEEKNLIEFFTGLYQEGKPFFGASAGAIMLAEKWIRWMDPDDDSSAELFPCLGFAPIICDCHDEDGGWTELQAALKLEKTIDVGYGLVAGSGVRVFQDGKVEAIGSAIQSYSRKGNRITRVKDISPVE